MEDRELEEIKEKEVLLNIFFQKTPKAALAFSGGADSSYLLYAAVKNGIQVRAYYVKSDFQPGFELEDARRLADELKADMRVLELEVLSDKRVSENPADRCYYCKKAIFSALLHAAHEEGYPVLLEGTNGSDDAKTRPGMRALKELAVRSPLRECGLTKPEIRRLSKNAGLFTWNKPAYACLATRIPTGTRITKEALVKTERAEGCLFQMGLRDFRVRMLGTAARIQVPLEQLELVLKNRENILQELKSIYTGVLLDLEVRGE